METFALERGRGFSGAMNQQLRLYAMDSRGLLEGGNDMLNQPASTSAAAVTV